MCGHRRRAARCGGAYGAENHYARPHGGHQLVMGLIEGVQQMRLASQQQALAATSTPVATPLPVAPQTANLGQQTRGIIYPLINGDEKKQIPQQENVNYEVLPTYEEVADVKKTNVTAYPVRSTEAQYVPTPIELPKNVNQSLASRGLNEFNKALASYKQGGCGGKCQAKRAAKNLVKDLANQEIERLKATHGPLVCGQRKQIRRDLKPVKSMLKAAVKEAKRERVD